MAIEELNAYADNFENLKGRVGEIRGYVQDHACDKSGFTGLLMVLQPGVDLVRSLFNETLDIVEDKLDSTAQGIKDTAAHYSEQDAKIQDTFTKIMDGLEKRV